MQWLSQHRLSHTGCALSRQSQPLLHGRIRRTRLTQAIMHSFARHRCVHRCRARARGRCTGITRLWLARRDILLFVASGALARAPLVLDPLLLRLRVLESALDLQARSPRCSPRAPLPRSPLPMLQRRPACGCRCTFVASACSGPASGCPPRWWPVPEIDLHRHRHRDGVDGALSNPARPAHSSCGSCTV